MPNKLKKLPKFKNEDEEREFWASHSSVDYFDWDNAVLNSPMPNLKPSTKTISIRLPEELLNTIKIEAHRRDMPYQSFMKAKLYEVFRPNL